MTSGVPYAEVIGDPVAHSKSPLIHRFWLEKLGVSGDYRATRVATRDLQAFLQERSADPRWLGCNVTLPLKVEVLRFLDLVDERARRIGAVNTIVARNGRMQGLNSDQAGFADPLRSSSKAFRSATVIGAGGAARAILAALREVGIGEVRLVNRDKERAHRLAAEWPEVSTVLPLRAGMRIEGTDLLVNATSLGMEGQPPLQVDLSGLAPGTLVYDIVYAPLQTGLLTQARALGLPVVDGLQMLVGQAAVAFSLLFGHDAPRNHDAELRDLLTS
jgi:shikimate dehydrogenase